MIMCVFFFKQTTAYEMRISDWSSYVCSSDLWELATIGDPLADFTYLAMNWAIPFDGQSGLGGLDLKQTGLPSLEDMIARYCEATGRDGLPDLHWRSEGRSVGKGGVSTGRSRW